MSRVQLALDAAIGFHSRDAPCGATAPGSTARCC